MTDHATRDLLASALYPVPSRPDTSLWSPNVAFASAPAREAQNETDLQRPEVGSLWRDREGNTWRLDRYNDGGPWCSLVGVTRFDGVTFEGARWHADWMLDLVRKAVQVDV